MAGKNNLSIRTIFNVFVIVILAYVAYKLINFINNFANDPVKQMFGAGVSLLDEVTGVINRCASCKNVYDSAGNLIPPNVACPPTGRAFFNRKCEEGLIIFFALFGNIIATFLKIIFSSSKYGKTELAKATEAATGRDAKDVLREESEKNDKFESDLKDPKTYEDFKSEVKKGFTTDDATKIDLLTEKEISQIGKNERTRRSLYDKLTTASNYTSEKAKELVATAFDFARNLGSKNDIDPDKLEKNVGEIEMPELGPRIE